MKSTVLKCSSQIFSRNPSNHSKICQVLTAALKQSWSLMKILHRCHHLLSHCTLQSYTQTWRAWITSSASTQPHSWTHGFLSKKMICMTDNQCFITCNQEASANKLFQKNNCAFQDKKRYRYLEEKYIYVLCAYTLQTCEFNLVNACKFLPSTYLFYFPGLPQFSNMKCSLLRGSINNCIYKKIFICI